MKENADTKPYPAILQRLQRFMDHMGLSAYQINKDAGLAKGLITNALSKGLGLTSGTLEALLNTYPQLDANWLITGRGEMLITKATGDTHQTSKQHLQDLQQLQDTCVELVRQIQAMKQRQEAEQADLLLQQLKR